MPSSRTFWAPQAWVDGAWARDVRLVAGPDGCWQSIESGVALAPSGAVELRGAVLPGVVNAHSHAFQRAIAGLTECSGAQDDDFWSWRDRMYRAALRIRPEQLEAVATQLYTELLAGGYTQVCEFHYLHNDLDGRSYADALTLSMALVRAAQATGIGLTLLPTLYMRSGFGVPRGRGALRDDQRRFASTPDGVLRLCEAVNRLQLPNVSAGVALHSLRAVDPAALVEVAQATQRMGVPVHIHIAEQTQEVNDCLAHHGQRPIEWLLGHLGNAGVPVDRRWNLVHATHTTPEELRALRAAQGAIVICPSTEANLGDGVFDLPGWLGADGPWSIGSDSHVTRRLGEELRLLEYGQRLVRRQRNVAPRVADPGAQDREGSTAAVLLQGALRGGGPATGLALGGLAVGQRADFSVIDAASDALAGIPWQRLLDAWVFSSPDAALQSPHVAGRSVGGSPDDRLAWRAGMVGAMQALWSAPG